MSSKDMLRIYGRTAIGRATVALLDLNATAEQNARQYLFTASYPRGSLDHEGTKFHEAREARRREGHG